MNPDFKQLFLTGKGIHKIALGGIKLIEWMSILYEYFKYMIWFDIMASVLSASNEISELWILCKSKKKTFIVHSTEKFTLREREEPKSSITQLNVKFLMKHK